MLAAVRRAYAWHRPLMTVSALMLVCVLVSLAGLFLDSRQILGAPAWAKPLKFSLSILIYAVTWAWLIAHLPRWQAAARGLGTVIAASLTVEQVLIVWAAASGTTSHFNVSSGLHAGVWAAMAAAITTLYLCTFATSFAVFFLRLRTPALTFAVRAGVVIALGGIGVAFLMTAPTSAQINTPTGIVGAHAVGVEDGGPGIPVLGWSTTGGDYRVAHFVGMHALQALPLFALLLEILTRRLPRLAAPIVHLWFVVIVAAGYAGGTALLTYQAALGQSVVHPSGAVLHLGWVLLLAGGLLAGAVGVGLSPPPAARFFGRLTWGRFRRPSAPAGSAGD
ncbi:hypothetical protein Kisp01_64230 [Kineosporia sp. NBRC 101677]|uniref:hypothetical protein n=1 Tax=Kineosporia sp. NBRC 101677 TaxID=3032197 RepID=UPI0024A17632|nr:hypothetical protein [Kineosporia sp. NBRC 101677]GLY19409.1 hypothetical protein Kisp01_64230 [Kineosporia sp. NBRC 101677]